MSQQCPKTRATARNWELHACSPTGNRRSLGNRHLSLGTSRWKTKFLKARCLLGHFRPWFSRPVSVIEKGHRPVLFSTKNISEAAGSFGDKRGCLERKQEIADPESKCLRETSQTSPSQIQTDGNDAAATIAYLLSEVAFVFPIAPSTPMAEAVEAWAAAKKKNVFGSPVSVVQMESEAGAAGAMHGGVVAGAFATTFTASQGFLLMIPNMYKMAGELVPCVIHVAARTLARHAASMYGDHQDVMAARQTGWGMLSSHSVQEAHDLALVAHLASLRSSIPFVHFFDGFRTSHEINCISEVTADTVVAILSLPVYAEAVRRHRRRAVSPVHPNQRGTVQGTDIYFQCCEAANPFYAAAPGHVEAAMGDLAAATGRRYGLFDFCGDPGAKDVVVIMGSGSSAAEEAAEHLRREGRRAGVVKVRCYRPWSSEHFLAALPASVERICVLDRTKESGSSGEPLFLDVANTVREDDDATGRRRTVIGGRYGVGGKEFSPAMAVAAFDNLRSPSPRRSFTVGINDDVTGLSLPIGPDVTGVPEGTTQCIFWGLGSDGTIGANKDAVRMIGGNTGMHAQAYFSFDAKKSGSVTVSHLRFGPEPIRSSYLISKADYLAVHQDSYMNRFDVMKGLKQGGTLVLNTRHTSAGELESFLLPHVLRQIHDSGARLYTIDARSVSELVGLGKRINMVMQTVFFALSRVIPMEDAARLLKESAAKTYSSKGSEVVEQNCWVVDNALPHLRRVEVPARWGGFRREPPPLRVSHAVSAKETAGKWQYIERIVMPMLRQEGDALPVSVFPCDGAVPPGTAAVEKRGIAFQVPAWEPSRCTECNMCSFVCPHAAIRPFLVSSQEAATAPEGFATIPGKGKDIHEYRYRMQVSPADCTGCNLCVKTCPTQALTPTPLEQMLSQESGNWDFAMGLPDRSHVIDRRETVRGSQFAPPLLEFSGACDGCQETAYIKTLTQLFGDHLILANATGCSSVWGAYSPSNPYTTNTEGFGPAWANSLFEDNAQFGLGISAASQQRRGALHRRVTTLLASELFPFSQELKDVLSEWVSVWQNANKSMDVSKRLISVLEREMASPNNLNGPMLGETVSAVQEIYHERDQLPKPSLWIVGGDGWAYDIGFGGLDHVLASNDNVNILVLDTEMYSNTGGQRSKASPPASVEKLATGGKVTPKKDLAQMAMTYGNVYVAMVNLGADKNQLVKAICEAEAYNGVSLIIAYAPCMLYGLKGDMESVHEHCIAASESGYWPMFRYHPSDGGLHLDSKKYKGHLHDLLKSENRFMMLARSNHELAESLAHELDETIRHRLHNMKNHPLSKRSNLPPFPQRESFDQSEFAFHEESNGEENVDGGDMKSPKFQDGK
uniref:pyruvate dehydrogenase (NADP(+)) n=1 Tax=Tetraselmis sp. GSL018 TaxID=582737 RepID=A0A061SAJ8_9CHLO|mmetsp:Transcript_14128/g.33372  ORF Transcript_14128/g.33372 Transcript_14128/m.33372 type:complete len:1357 (-) Transcript_14128:127-4197(-)